jgi:hypothetical protein
MTYIYSYIGEPLISFSNGYWALNQYLNSSYNHKDPKFIENKLKWSILRVSDESIFKIKNFVKNLGIDESKIIVMKSIIFERKK